MAVALHRFSFIETIPFFWSLMLVGCLALAGLITAIGAFWQMWEYGMTGFWGAVRGFVLSVLLLMPYGIALALYATRPPLVDLMTDVVSPPEFDVAARMRQGPMNPILPLSQAAGLRHLEAYPDLAGRRYEQPREQVLTAVLTLVEKRGWARLTAAPVADPGDEGDGMAVVEAAGQTMILGIPFDVAIRVEEREDATYVDMRSVSRYGTHDLGLNAWQIRSFLDDLDTALAEMAGA